MNKIMIVGGAGAIIGLFYFMTRSSGSTVQEEGILDSAQTTIDEAIGVVSAASPVSEMQTSQAMLDKLKCTESLRLTKYKLNDGGNGWSIGYGHKFQLGETVLDSITIDQAEAMFAQDVAQRAEKWVKLYVSVDQTQNQFDALVSIAYNMSPQSFKKFANAVNNGDGIEAIANESIGWPAPEYRNGIANRRAAEIQIYNNGLYA